MWAGLIADRRSSALRRTCARAVLAALCGLAVACGGGGQPQSAAAPSPTPAVITMAQARQVVANYIATLNQANQQRDASLLGTVETEASYDIDSEAYGWTRISDPSNSKYVRLAVAQATYYIPARTAGAPWWVASVTWPSGTTYQNGVAEYLVFTRSGGKWLAARTPGLASGATVPAPAVGRQGAASELTDSQAASLAVRPSDIAAQMATYLTQLTVPLCPRPGLCGKPPAARVQIPTATSQTDMSDLTFWRGQAGGALAVGEQHSPRTDLVYAMATADGGALVWCDVGAQLSLAAPDGSAMHLQIPTFYTNAQSETQATVPYLDQYLVYDPPQGQGDARVVADLTGPIAKS